MARKTKETNTSEEKILAEGLRFKRPHVKAPEFVKGSVSVNVERFVEFIQTHEKNGYVNLDLLVSKQDNPYFTLNTWSPEETERRAVTI